MATPEENVSTPRREVSGAQLALVIGGVLVALALVWFFLLRGGDDSESALGPPPEAPVASPEPTVTLEPPGRSGGGSDRQPVETFEVFAPRDPFDPLVSEDGGAGGGDTDTSGTDTTGTDTSDTTGTGTTDGEDDGGVEGDGSGSGASGTEDNSADVQGNRVELVATLGGGRAQIKVNSTVYTVDEGEQFAQNFELLSASADCATLLYGDDQFSMCEGEEILK